MGLEAPRRKKEDIKKDVEEDTEGSEITEGVSEGSEATERLTVGESLTEPKENPEPPTKLEQTSGESPTEPNVADREPGGAEIHHLDQARRERTSGGVSKINVNFDAIRSSFDGAQSIQDIIEIVRGLGRTMEEGFIWGEFVNSPEDLIVRLREYVEEPTQENLENLPGSEGTFLYDRVKKILPPQSV